MNIMIDMDSTLFDTSYSTHDAVPQYVLEDPENTQEIGFSQMAIYRQFVTMRPGVIEFLTFCKENFDKMFLCTYSKRNRTNEVLLTFGIKHYFNGLICFEDLYETMWEDGSDFILVDDAPISSQFTLCKMNYFGVDEWDISKHLINIEPYSAKLDPNRQDRELFKMIDTLKNKNIH